MARIDLARRAEIGREKRARTRAQIVEAGTVLLAERPPEALTVDAVVEAAGVAKGTFYYHFQSMEELAAAVGEKAKDGRPKPGVCHYAKEAGADLVKVLVPPGCAPKGWDAGDMIAAGADRDKIEAFIAKQSVMPDRARKEFERQEDQQPG